MAESIFLDGRSILKKQYRTERQSFVCMLRLFKKSEKFHGGAMNLSHAKLRQLILKNLAMKASLKLNGYLTQIDSHFMKRYSIIGSMFKLLKQL